jgi:Flp pilus assembly pilin Flp
MSRLQAGRAGAVQESAQTFVEYALILAVVVVGVLLTVTWVGLTDIMQTAMDAVSAAV